MKYRRLISICFIVLLTVQFVPVNLSSGTFLDRDLNQLSLQRIESSDSLSPPQVLKHISPSWDFGAEYDMIQNYSSIASIIFDPLVEYSLDTQELIPALATQWVVTNDSKHWIFTLREDVTFHDGTKFNASSVKFTYDRFIDLAHPAYVARPVLELNEMPLESVEILDEYKVSINFNEAYAPFIYKEAPYCGIFSPNSFGGGPNITIPIGTGPYYLDEIASNATFKKFLRNDQYYRGIPPFEEYHFYHYDDLEDYQAALQSDDAGFTTWGMNMLPENDTYWEEILVGDGIRYGVFNHLHPIIDDPNVRLAINYAVNKEFAVSQDVGGYSKRVKSLRSVIYSGDPYHDETIEGYPYNVERANSILDQAGYAPLGDGYRFDIELVGSSYDELAAIRDELDLISIRCNIITASIRELFDDYIYPGNFDLFIVGWTPLLDPSLSKSLLHTSGNINWGNYSNPGFDIFTVLGQESPVRQEREYYYSQAQKIAQKDAPLLLLYETKRIYLIATNVTQFLLFTKSGRITFNYTSQEQDDDIYNMEGIEIASDPIYFPFTDGLITLESQQIEGNMTMTHDLSNLISGQQKKGKYYEVRVNDSDVEYNLKCYYDLDEIASSTRSKVQEIFQWNISSQSWVKLDIIRSSTDLRYSEVRVKGNVILRIGIIDLLELTFRYFSIILIITLPIIGVSAVVIMKNRKIMKKIKGEFDLS